MNPEEVVSVIREIAKMLEPSAQAAWELAVRQVMVAGWIGVLVGGLLSLAGLASATRALVVCDQGGDHEGVYAAGFIGGITAPFMLLWFILSLQRLLNPEWYAIQLLVGLAKGG